MRNEPRLKCCPLASNGSSAAWKSASFNLYRSVASALSAFALIAYTDPEPLTPPGAVIVPVTSAIGVLSTIVSTTRIACTANPSGNVQPVSSYGFFCGSFGDQYWPSSSASAGRAYGWPRATTYYPAPTA